MALLLMFLVAVCGFVIVLYLYFALRSRITTQMAQQRDILRAAAAQEAQDQLAKWREQELDQSKQQQLEIARQEAALQLGQWKQAQEQTIRQDAIQRSQSVTVGKITEHLVPYLPGFTYNPKDARFIGSPIDLIIFDGLNDGDIRKIVFVEVKTGASNLNARERRVRDAVVAGRVEWIEYRPAVDANSAALP